jgi:hypothetical protein
MRHPARGPVRRTGIDGKSIAAGRRRSVGMPSADGSEAAA